jgi:predicted ATPase
MPGLKIVSERAKEEQVVGPLDEYVERVHSRRLRYDEHQMGNVSAREKKARRGLISWRCKTGIVQHLQDLHEELAKYRPPKVIHPTPDDLKPHKPSLFRSLLGKLGAQQQTQSIPANAPKGLYMYGDVGSGKTMLMDLLYDTLPGNITAKTRIHFHNFMQQVHRDLHKLKTRMGSDMDLIPFVAADIADKSSVLCFDEFQCTDVADAMILRRSVSP